MHENRVISDFAIGLIEHLSTWISRTISYFFHVGKGGFKISVSGVPCRGIYYNLVCTFFIPYEIFNLNSHLLESARGDAGAPLP